MINKRRSTNAVPTSEWEQMSPVAVGSHGEVYIDSRVEPKIIKDIDLELAR